MLIFLVKCIALLVAGLGLMIFALPKNIHKVFAFIREGKRIYWAGVVRCLVGFVLLLSASKSVLPVATVSVGMIFLLSGIVVFACDPEKLKGLFAHSGEMPVIVIRLLGLVVASFGLLVFSIV